MSGHSVTTFLTLNEPSEKSKKRNTELLTGVQYEDVWRSTCRVLEEVQRLPKPSVNICYYGYNFMTCCASKIAWEFNRLTWSKYNLERFRRIINAHSEVYSPKMHISISESYNHGVKEYEGIYKCWIDRLALFITLQFLPILRLEKFDLIFHYYFLLHGHRMLLKYAHNKHHWITVSTEYACNVSPFPPPVHTYRLTIHKIPHVTTPLRMKLLFYPVCAFSIFSISLDSKPIKIRQSSLWGYREL